MSNHPHLYFCPSLQSALDAGEMLGLSGERHGINAITDTWSLRVLYDLCRQIIPVNTIEIGFAKGGSAAAICSAFRDCGVSPDKQHTAIDPYAFDVWDGTGYKLLEQAQLDGYCNIVTTPSYIALPELVTKGYQAQLLYIDGSHFFEYVFTDFFLGEKVLSEGGYLVFDDLRRPEVAKTVRFIMKNCTTFFERVKLKELEDSKFFTQKKRLKNLLGIVDLAVFRKRKEFTRDMGIRFRGF